MARPTSNDSFVSTDGVVVSGVADIADISVIGSPPAVLVSCAFCPTFLSASFCSCVIAVESEVSEVLVAPLSPPIVSAPSTKEYPLETNKLTKINGTPKTITIFLLNCVINIAKTI